VARRQQGEGRGVGGQDLKFRFKISETTEMLISHLKLSVFFQIFVNLIKFYFHLKSVKISKNFVRKKIRNFGSFASLRKKPVGGVA
jgi:hypothetical protein